MSSRQNNANSRSGLAHIQHIGADAIPDARTGWLEQEGDVAKQARPEDPGPRWEVDFENARCYFDIDGDGTYETASGTLATHLEWVMTPTAAEVVGGRWVVTAMSDVEAGRGVNTVVDPGDCGDAFYAGDTSRTIIEVTRQS